MPKYNYDTRPDLVEDQKAYIKTSSECIIQTWIANELAEANRLSRKDIEWSHPELSGKMLQEVKEDRA